MKRFAFNLAFFSVKGNFMLDFRNHISARIDVELQRDLAWQY